MRNWKCWNVEARELEGRSGECGAGAGKCIIQLLIYLKI